MDEPTMAYNIQTLRQKGILVDTNTIRAGCFCPYAGGDHFAIGTNSKSLKICNMENIFDRLNKPAEEDDDDKTQTIEDIEVIFE